jgi:predicted 2-oxoglutarate/Fe(II)-dependent dioxygenase YbiX
MIKITDFIHCYENMLDKNICQEIIKNSENLTFEKAPVLNEVTDHRKCYYANLDGKFNNDVFKAVDNVINEYAKDHVNFTTGLSLEDTGYHHLIYIGAQKGEYKEHTDHADITPRVLSCSFILNDNYDGGDFVFFGGKYKVTKKAGSAIVFPSNFCFPHAVTPVINGDRHAIITWIR